MRTHKGPIGLSALLACFGAAGISQAQDNEINWLGNYRDAVQQARQTGKPILVEFRCEA
jgi:hypothetical protein